MTYNVFDTSPAASLNTNILCTVQPRLNSSFICSFSSRQKGGRSFPGSMPINPAPSAHPLLRQPIRAQCTSCSGFSTNHRASFVTVAASLFFSPNVAHRQNYEGICSNKGYIMSNHNKAGWLFTTSWSCSNPSKLSNHLLYTAKTLFTIVLL